ncbi:hypothetical protein RmaAA213_11960 [Rhodothermus marinus]|nr:hypothetical protein RmaAA213_11960 [Rhodothermus marinus]BBM72332.1 hypothetical protein RmaAA338_11970 [Rhodothermus marinus]
MRVQMTFYPLSRFATAPPERGSGSGSWRLESDTGACVRFNAGVSPAAHPLPEGVRDGGRVKWEWSKRKNHPLSRFAAAPPARGSRICGLRLAVARVPGRISVSLSSLMCFPLPAREGARGRVRLLVAGTDVRGAGVGGWRRLWWAESTGAWDVAPSCTSKSAITYKGQKRC